MDVQSIILEWLRTATPIVTSKFLLEFSMLKESTSMFSMQTVQSDLIVSQDVLGNRKMKYIFMLILRTAPDTTKKRIDREAILNGVGLWVEAKKDEYPHKDITKIVQTTIAAIINKANDGFTDYACTFEVNYKEKGNG